MSIEKPMNGALLGDKGEGVGVITPKWKTEPLKSLISYIAKGIPPAYIEIEGENTVRVLNQKCNRDFAINYEKSRLHDLSKRNVPYEKYLRNEDILINSTGTGTAGRIAQLDTVPCPTIVDGHMIVLRGGEKVKARYLGYALKAQQAAVFQLEEGSTGQTELNRDRLLTEIEISYPISLDKQNSIINTLRALDDKIDLNRKMCKTLEAMAQTLFKSWFVDFDPVRAKMEGRTPYGMDAETAALFPDTLVDSELGLIPKGWEVGEIGNITDIQGGFAFKSKDFCLDGYPIIKIKNVNQDKTIDTFNVDYVSKNIAMRARSFWLNDGDLLIAMTGATVGKFGLLINNQENISILNQRVGRFLPQQDGIGFLYCSLSIKQTIDTLINSSYGSAQPNISTSQIMSVMHLIPTTNLISLFNKTVEVFFSTVIKNRKEIVHLESIRDYLLPKLISGEVRVG